MSYQWTSHRDMVHDLSNIHGQKMGDMLMKNVTIDKLFKTEQKQNQHYYVDHRTGERVPYEEDNTDDEADDLRAASEPYRRGPKTKPGGSLQTFYHTNNINNSNCMLESYFLNNNNTSADSRTGSEAFSFPAFVSSNSHTDTIYNRNTRNKDTTHTDTTGDRNTREEGTTHTDTIYNRNTREEGTTHTDTIYNRNTRKKHTTHTDTTDVKNTGEEGRTQPKFTAVNKKEEDNTHPDSTTVTKIDQNITQSKPNACDLRLSVMECSSSISTTPSTVVTKGRAHKNAVLLSLQKKMLAEQAKKDEVKEVSCTYNGDVTTTTTETTGATRRTEPKTNVYVPPHRRQAQGDSQPDTFTSRLRQITTQDEFTNKVKESTRKPKTDANNMFDYKTHLCHHFTDSDVTDRIKNIALGDLNEKSQAADSYPRFARMQPGVPSFGSREVKSMQLKPTMSGGNTAQLARKQEMLKKQAQDNGRTTVYGPAQLPHYYALSAVTSTESPSPDFSLPSRRPASAGPTTSFHLTCNEFPPL